MTKKIISLEISDELKEILRIAAFKANKTVSALIRDTLQEKFGESDDNQQNTEN